MYFWCKFPLIRLFALFSFSENIPRQTNIWCQHQNGSKNIIITRRNTSTATSTKCIGPILAQHHGERFLSVLERICFYRSSSMKLLNVYKNDIITKFCLRWFTHLVRRYNIHQSNTWCQNENGLEKVIIVKWYTGTTFIVFIISLWMSGSRIVHLWQFVMNEHKK